MLTEMKFITLILFLFIGLQSNANDGYNLWLNYGKIENESMRQNYLNRLNSFSVEGESDLLQSAQTELTNALTKLLDTSVPFFDNSEKSDLIIGVFGTSALIDNLIPKNNSNKLISEGFIIFDTGNKIIITGLDAKGVLYGTFHFIRRLQMNLPIEGLNIIENPKIKHRILNHWDNLDGTVERGYAGFSIWNWHQLPEYIDPRYIDYARTNASIGINGTVVTNVNANSLIFREDYIEKAAALADVLRKYGIKLYLTARFSSPIELGLLETADPNNEAVQKWWQEKVAEIYKHIPDFGGFLVKANSEGQPGPQQFGRNHADGANMLADALLPYGGIVMWRAFVYSDEVPDDRAKQAYNEFVPLDGLFRKNVIIQVKNGPIDFQPKEPIHPLFGGLTKTPMMMELQITKEYLGQGTHLVGLGKMYEETLNTDTYALGKGSTVAKVIDGSLYNHELTGMAGVANIGTARNWTGNLFGQADWFAFGKLAWNPYEKSETIFKEWALSTFSKNKKIQSTVYNLLSKSYEACVQYITPLGLHHIMGTGHHYGPGPWVADLSRADWNPVYYHKADLQGIGFDRTESGSNALAQYKPEFASKYKDIETCPKSFLLWFHHVPWDYKLDNGNTLWAQLCEEYNMGVEKVMAMRKEWITIKDYMDEERFNSVLMHLNIQEKEAVWWRDACLSYFQSFSKMEIPKKYEQPKYDLDYYKSLSFPYAPGINPKW